MMSTVLNGVLMANREYAARFDKGGFAHAPKTALCHFNLYGRPP